MTSPSLATAAGRPPSKHQLALMIWLAVFPTLVILNLALGRLLQPASPVIRTFALVTLAVPIVNYLLMPTLLRLRKRLLTAQTTHRVSRSLRARTHYLTTSVHARPMGLQRRAPRKGSTP